MGYKNSNSSKSVNIPSLYFEYNCNSTLNIDNISYYIAVCNFSNLSSDNLQFISNNEPVVLSVIRPSDCPCGKDQFIGKVSARVSCDKKWIILISDCRLKIDKGYILRD